MLSQAWNADVDDIKGFLAAQKETAIIKVEKSKVWGAQYGIVDAGSLYMLVSITAHCSLAFLHVLHSLQ